MHAFLIELRKRTCYVCRWSKKPASRIGGVKTYSTSCEVFSNFEFSKKFRLREFCGTEVGGGRRIERTVNGNTIGYLYDGAQAIAELRSNAIDTVYHAGLAIDEVLARYGSAGSRSLLTDALGSVIALADDAQNAQNFYSYSPYGEVNTLGSDGGNTIQYTGRENDQTGLYFYRARYYDPVLKQLISEDPAGLRAGSNVYAYVSGNPLRYADPSGQIGTLGYVGEGMFVIGALITSSAPPLGITMMVVGVGLVLYSTWDDTTELTDAAQKPWDEMQKSLDKIDKLSQPEKPEPACPSP